jgi:Asp-tRNA(Asn)/Glu-tRNA(Gln) amidotransferase A subunit family amidase
LLGPAPQQWLALGALDGIPLTMKDKLFVGGVRATWGSALFADLIGRRPRS